MLPAYKESYTCYTTPSGNMQLYLYRRKPTRKRISVKKKYIIQQKFLGLVLFLLGVVFIAIFPEDAMGGLFAGFLGIVRLVCD